MDKKMFGRYRLVAAMVVCMLMCTACKKEGYNTDSLKEVNVLTTEIASEGGEATIVHNETAGDYDMTLDEAMDMREEIDGETENIQWTDIEDEYQETGGGNQEVTYEDIDISPSQELEQAFDDIINGEYEGEDGAVTVGVGSMERE